MRAYTRMVASATVMKLTDLHCSEAEDYKGDQNQLIAEFGE